MWLLLATSQTYAQGAQPDEPTLTLPQAADRVLLQKWGEGTKKNFQVNMLRMHISINIFIYIAAL